MSVYSPREPLHPQGTFEMDNYVDAVYKYRYVGVHPRPIACKQTRQLQAILSWLHILSQKLATPIQLLNHKIRGKVVSFSTVFTPTEAGVSISYY